MTIMRKKKILVLFLLLTSPGFSHDIKMAIFEVSQGKSGLQLDIVLDKEDFLKTLSSNYGDNRYDPKDLQYLASQYFDSHLIIRINDQCTKFTVAAMEQNRYTITLSGSLNMKVDGVEKVQIENYCMIDEIDRHENIVRLKLNNSDRSFRLNSHRVLTAANY